MPVFIRLLDRTTGLPWLGGAASPKGQDLIAALVVRSRRASALVPRAPWPRPSTTDRGMAGQWFDCVGSDPFRVRWVRSIDQGSGARTRGVGTSEKCSMSMARHACALRQHEDEALGAGYRASPRREAPISAGGCSAGCCMAAWPAVPLDRSIHRSNAPMHQAPFPRSRIEISDRLGPVGVYRLNAVRSSMPFTAAP